MSIYKGTDLVAGALMINDAANQALSNLTNGLSNTICTTPATTTSTASSATPAVVVENYVNGTSWYRVYSDGWCEQGGQFVNNDSTFSVALLKTMSNTNYSVFVTLGENNKSASFSINVGSRTTTGFTGAMSSSTTTYKSCWRACGYVS